MNKFYSQLASNPDDLSPIVDAYDHYLAEFEEAKMQCDGLLKKGRSLESAITSIAAIWGQRTAQLSELEQIIGFLENREKRLLGTLRRRYREHYNRELTDSMVEKYAETDPDLLDLAEIRNMIALPRNKFLALTKQLESMHYQITNLTKLRATGIEDATI